MITDLIAVIPKSNSKERIIQNSQIFEFQISEEDMKILFDMDKNHHFCWDSTLVP